MRVAQLGRLESSDRAPNLLIGDRVEIDATAQIGANVVLHDDVSIGPNAVVKHGAVVGALRSYAAGSNSEPTGPAATRLDAGAIVCMNAIVVAGATLGPGSLLGDFGFLSAYSRIGERSVVGAGTQVGIGTDIGARVRIQNATIITPRAIIEDDAFVGPGVMFTTDNTLARKGTGENWGITLRRACRISAGVVFTPGVEIGEEAFVAAGAVVTKDVGPREKIRGVPGKLFGTVSDEELLENWR